MDVSRPIRPKYRPQLCLLSALCLVSLVLAFPRQTDPAYYSYAINGRSPKPTSPPSGMVELARRDDISTCGYIHGNKSDPLNCLSGATCSFASGQSFLDCCGQGECTIHTTCYPASSRCSGDCTLARICSDSTSSECKTFVYTDIDYTAFGCDATSAYYHVARTASPAQTSSSTSATPTSEPTPTPTPGLSTGAKVGIGVGVGVGTPAAICLALFFPGCGRRNRQVINNKWQQIGGHMNKIRGKGNTAGQDAPPVPKGDSSPAAPDSSRSS